MFWKCQDVPGMSQACAWHMPVEPFAVRDIIILIANQEAEAQPHLVVCPVTPGRGLEGGLWPVFGVDALSTHQGAEG